jgi:starch-binding outer membrane protein SusE/F
MMKNIIKIVILFITIALSSCTELAKDPLVSSNGLLVNKDVSVISPSVLNPTIDTGIFGKYNWSVADNGPASVSKYSLVIFDHDNDLSLSNPVEYTGTGVVVTADSREASITNKEFNDLLNKLQKFNCGEMSVDLRIKSVLGANPTTALVQYSNPINYKITGYSKSTPILSFVKDGNTASSEPKLLSSGYTSNTDYEGYVYLQAGNYKFYKPDACGSYTSPTILGGTGSLATGTIDASATPASIVIANAGHYLIKANLLTNTFSIKEYRTFGIFGSGVRISGTGNAAPMTDNNDNVWKITVDLIKGRAYRFKSNLWTGAAVTPNQTNIGTVANPIYVQFPDFIPPSGTTTISLLGKSTAAGQVVEVTGSDGEFTVPGTIGTAADRQKYEVILDVSKPRNYTYTITPKS